MTVGQSKSMSADDPWISPADRCKAIMKVQGAQEESWLQLFCNVLSEEMAYGDDLVGGDPMSESYRSLVMRGVLIDSFKKGSSYIVETVPKLYLHRWIKKYELNREVRSLLWQILRMVRFECTPLAFEIIHFSWEQLMRHVHQGNPEYSKIRLNDLYRIKLRNGAAPEASCLVDGRSILKPIWITKGTNITLQPNTIYRPEGPNQKFGWDMLIVLEVFEVSPGIETSERYLLPLFILNRFSEDALMTNIAFGEVNSANDHCKTFMESPVTFDSEYSPFSTAGDNFILLFVAKCEMNNNVCTDSPSNVMFCCGEDLEKLYGPTLKGFLSSKEIIDDFYTREFMKS